MSELIVVADVVSLSARADGTSIARAVPIESWKGSPGSTIEYVASGSWTCDTSTAKLGERVVLFLDASESGELLIAHSGTGRMPTFEFEGQRYASFRGSARFPASMLHDLSRPQATNSGNELLVDELRPFIESLVAGRAPAGLADERDRAVLEAMLLAVLADPECNRTRTSVEAPMLVLDVRVPAGTGMLRPTQTQHDIGEGHEIPPEIQDDLLRRNETPGSYGVSFTRFDWDRSLLVADVSELTGARRASAFREAYPRARAWLSAWLPGYSADGTQAIARACIGPSAHGAVVTAGLEKRDGKWVVTWQHVAFFA